MISATSSFTYFALLTLAYFVLRYLMVDKYENKGNSALGIALIIVYLGIMFLIQFMVNMSNAKERCGGTPQILTALTYTAIPNILIFGLLIMMIMFFPGWKAPFSNTLGYLIVSSPIFRARDVFNNILVKKSSNKQKITFLFFFKKGCCQFIIKVLQLTVTHGILSNKFSSTP